MGEFFGFAEDLKDIRFNVPWHGGPLGIAFLWAGEAWIRDSCDTGYRTRHLSPTSPFIQLGAPA